MSIHSKPLISSIMIFLNAKEFMQEAIESVFTQSYADWELLLVDDGSTDGSTAIALHYAQQHPDRVRYLEHDGHQNRGMSATRNLGIRRAKGEYIAFLDADDVWLPTTLEEQAVLLQAQPDAVMVYGPIQWWYSWTGKPEDSQRDFVEGVGVQPNTLIEPPTLLTLLLEGKVAIPSGMLMRREIIEGIGGFEETFKGLYEDQVLCAKVCLQSPVFVASECWYKYRQHPDSCCSVGLETGKEYSARRTFLNWLEKYLSDKGFKDTQVWQALQKELWPYRYPKLFRLLERPRHLLEQMKGIVRLIGRRTLPTPVRRWLRVRWQSRFEES